LPMSQTDAKKIDRKKLPLIYRILLEIPGANFFGNCSSGVFWAIIVPIFVVVEYSITMISLVAFTFPVNILAAATIPTLVLLVFARISLERSINWWNIAVGENTTRNIDETMPEYLDLVNKQKEE